jgi:hypothetical protein
MGIDGLNIGAITRKIDVLVRKIESANEHLFKLTDREDMDSGIRDYIKDMNDAERVEAFNIPQIIYGACKDIKELLGTVVAHVDS